jgi:pectin lyase
MAHRLGLLALVSSLALAQQPVDFAQQPWGTTGGVGGPVVVVRTMDELRLALCDNRSGGTCLDTTPRIVQIATVIDYTGSEGKAAGVGCFYSDCANPTFNARILDFQSAYCINRTKFDVQYDKAGHPSQSLLVGSNKSLVGIGAGAGIRGKGIYVSKNNSNVVIRNLAITDINDGIIFAGDAITLDGSDRVWIDHVYFARIGRQFIVTGFNTNTRVTMSFNLFDGVTKYSPYCNDKHYWNLLWLGRNDTITFFGNHLKDFSGRGPKVGSDQQIQIVNNLFTAGFWHAIDYHAPSQLLMEGNYFSNVSIPIMRKDTGPGLLYAPFEAPSAEANALCQSAFKRNCVGNIAVGAKTVISQLETQVIPDLARLSPGAIIAPIMAAAEVPRLIPGMVGPKGRFKMITMMMPFPFFSSLGILLTLRHSMLIITRSCRLQRPNHLPQHPRNPPAPHPQANPQSHLQLPRPALPRGPPARHP